MKKYNYGVCDNNLTQRTKNFKELTQLPEMKMELWYEQAWKNACL